MRKQHLEAQLKALPAKPGVYVFRAEDGRVLYIGKAKSLRPRVRSYFQATPDTGAQIAQLPAGGSRTSRVIVTGTEAEALHVEQNLVQAPPAAVQHPPARRQVVPVHRGDGRGRVPACDVSRASGTVAAFSIFGPYANAKKVRETLDVLNRVFQFRPCEGPKPGRHSGIPCLDYHIERCKAPCVGYISKEEYGELIDRVIEFLSGETRPVLRELERQMQEPPARSASRTPPATATVSMRSATSPSARRRPALGSAPST